MSPFCVCCGSDVLVVVIIVVVIVVVLCDGFRGWFHLDQTLASVSGPVREGVLEEL